MKFTPIDGSPVPSAIAPVVQRIRDRSGATLSSCYRGGDPAAAGILRRFGKSTQAYLWNGFMRHLPGFNPANPPGFSTHELFNDGVAYRVPRGTPLRAYQVGMDWAHPGGAAAVCREAVAEGYIMTVTYPGSVGERQHANFRKPPRALHLVLRPLRKGDKGLRVKLLTKRLMICRRPHEVGHPHYLTEPSNTFTTRVEEAVRQFQHDHGQHSDGVVGPQTQAQIMVSVRFQVHKRK